MYPYYILYSIDKLELENDLQLDLHFNKTLPNIVTDLEMGSS